MSRCLTYARVFQPSVPIEMDEDGGLELHFPVLDDAGKLTR